MLDPERHDARQRGVAPPGGEAAPRARRDDERARAGRHHDRDGVGPCDLAGPRRRAGSPPAARTARAASGEWTVMGASRGEAGILGEGIRQALLRDKSYGPGAEGRADDGVVTDREVVITEDVAGAAAERIAAAVRRRRRTSRWRAARRRARRTRSVAAHGPRLVRHGAVVRRRPRRAARPRALQLPDGEGEPAGSRLAARRPPDRGRAGPRGGGRRLRGRSCGRGSATARPRST